MSYSWGSFKNLVFPIERSELKLFSQLAIILFCILANFSFLRTLKDGLVIPLIGAESISFLKLWLVLPTAVVFTILYVKLSNVFELDKLFSILVGLFVCILLIFAFLIYPYENSYHISADKSALLMQQLPYVKWFIKIFSKWSYAVVYILAELWGAMVINLMFWQFANNLFSTPQAQRIYPILGIFGSFGLILAGKLLIIFAQAELMPLQLQNIFSSSNNLTEITIKLIVTFVSITSIISIIIFRSIYANFLLARNVSNNLDYVNTKTSLSVYESIKLITHSRYIFYIFILVISYSLAINLLEGPWKHQMSQLYTNPCDYMKFMGNFNIWMGLASVAMTIIGGNILRLFGWKTSAYITPIMIGITGTLFFIFVLLDQKPSFGLDVIYISVFLGALQNILSKSSKYSLFDSTKEMLYIPLSLELRSKGKAAVEIIGSKLGKSLGAFLQFVAFSIVPDLNFDRISIFLMIFFLIVVVLWLFTVGKVGQEYYKLNNVQNN